MTNKVTTTRPSYSFSKANSTRKSEARKKTTTTIRPWSSSPTKKTITPTPPPKTAGQELASCSHQKAHADTINNSSHFRSKTSLTPRSAINFFNNAPTSPIHTLNFSTASKISPATTSSSNIHATGKFQPKITPPASVRYLIETIMETDNEIPKGRRFRMEDGFENSPMAKLLQEYGLCDSDGQSLSTETKVQLIIEVEELGPEMIVDRGPDRQPGLPR